MNTSLILNAHRHFFNLRFRYQETILLEQYYHFWPGYVLFNHRVKSIVANKYTSIWSGPETNYKNDVISFWMNLFPQKNTKKFRLGATASRLSAAAAQVLMALWLTLLLCQAAPCHTTASFVCVVYLWSAVSGSLLMLELGKFSLLHEEVGKLESGGWK